MKQCAECEQTNKQANNSKYENKIHTLPAKCTTSKQT